MPTRTNWPIWRPPNEMFETFAEVIAAHWKAAKARRERRFWPSAQSWFAGPLDPPGLARGSSGLGLSLPLHQWR